MLGGFPSGTPIRHLSCSTMALCSQADVALAEEAKIGERGMAGEP